MKLIKTLLILMAVTLLVLILSYSNVIFAIFKLHYQKEDIVEISSSSSIAQTYISKSESGDQVIIELLEQQGFRLADHLGSSYFFENNEYNYIISKKIYAKKYFIWKMEQTENSN